MEPARPTVSCDHVAAARGSFVALGRLGFWDLMLNIRRFEPQDHEAILKLHNLALIQVCAHAGPGLWDQDSQDIPGVYFGAGGEFLVGLIDDRIVAMGALRRTCETKAEVKRMTMVYCLA